MAPAVPPDPTDAPSGPDLPEGMARVLQSALLEEKRLRAVFETAHEGIYLTNERGEITQANAALEKMLGWTREELHGRNLAEVFLPPEQRAQALLDLDRLRAEGAGKPPFTLRREYLCKDASRVKVDTTISVILHENELMGVVFVAEVGARLAAESAAKAVFRASHDAIVVQSLAGRILDMNQSAELLTGHRLSEVRGKELAEVLVPPPGRERFLEILSLARSGHEVPEFNRLLRRAWLRKDGGEVPIDLVIVPLMTQTPPVLISFAKDASSEIAALESERKAKALFQTLVDNSADLITLCDFQKNFVFISPSMKAILGHEPASLLGTLGSDLMHPEDRVQAGEDLRKLAAGELGSAITTRRFRHADGSWRRLEAHLRLLGPESPVQGTLMQARDVEPEFQARESAAQREQLFTAIVENSPDLTLLLDFDGSIRFASSTCRDLTGWGPEELRGRHHHDFVHPEDQGASLQALRAAGGGVQNVQLRLKHKERDWIRFEARLRLLPLETGMGGILIKARNIEEQHRVREALRRSEAYHRSIVEHSWDLLAVTDTSGRIEQVSPSLAAAFETPIEKFPGSTVETLVAEEDRPRLAELVQAAARGEDGRNDSDLRLRLPGGARLFELRVRPMEEEGTRRVLIKARDVQSERDHQHEIMTYQRLAVFGQLAAGFAHEVRNPLAAIASAAQLAALRQAEPGRDLTPQLEVILRQSQRLRHLMDDLLQHARGARAESVPVDPCDAMDKAVDLALQQFGPLSARTQVQRAFGQGRGRVKASEERLIRLLANLVLNALQAMGEGGGVLKATTAFEGREAVLRVQDSGPGIPPRIKEHLFEPFYTTKDTGSGLGLWIAQSVAQEIGGRLGVEDAEPHGALFTLRLPLIGEP